MAQTTIPARVDRIRKFAMELVGRARRRRQPSRKQLMGMRPEEFERYLERRGIAGRVRDAIAESERSGH